MKDKHAYILAPQNVKAGDSVVSGPTASIRPGNTLPLTSIPLGSTIHNVELLPGRGGQIARSAGTSATLISRGKLFLCNMVPLNRWVMKGSRCVKDRGLPGYVPVCHSQAG